MNFLAWGSLADSLTTTAGSLTSTVASGTNVAAGDSIQSVNVPPGTTVGAISGTTVTLALAPQWWPGNIKTGVNAITGMMAGNPGAGTSPSSLATLVGATILNSPYFASGTTIVGVGPDGTSLQTSSPAVNAPAVVGPVQICFAPTGNAIVTTGADANATIVGSATPYNATLQIERSFDGGATWLPCNIGGGGQIAKYTTHLPISIAFGDPEASVLYRWNCLAFGATTNVTLNYRISTTGQAGVSVSVPSIM